MLNKCAIFDQNIEKRLDKVENELSAGDISEMKRNISSIKVDLDRGSYMNSPSFSVSSDQSSQCDHDQSDRGSEHDQAHLEGHHHEGHSGLLLSDSDLTKVHATQISEQLGCKMPMLNYNNDNSDNVHNVLVRTNHDFVLIQESGNIVDKQDTVNYDSMEEVQNCVRNQLELARTVVRLKPNTEVFIGSLPPRFDTPEHAQLTEAYNNTLVAESFLDDHVTIVSQDGMNSYNKKKLQERFAKDGATLTKYGNYLMSKNISREVTKKVPNLIQRPGEQQGRKFKYSKAQVQRLLGALFA